MLRVLSLDMHPILIAFSINTLTLILKVLGYIDTKSVALFADILNDLGDCIGLALLILGLYISRKKKSSIAYPFGMSRAVYVFGLISISIIGGVLFSISLVNTLNTMFFTERADIPTSKGIARLFVLPALVLNGVGMLYSFNSFLNKGRNDPASIGAVVDSVTDFTAGVFAFVAVHTLNKTWDSVGGIVVSTILLVSAVTIGYRYFIVLIGRAPPKHELLKMLNAALSVPGVLDVNELRAVMITEDEYLVILEVEVKEDIEVEDAESISMRIENEVRRAIPKVKHVVVEIVPRKLEPPTYKRILEEIRRLSE